MNAIYLTALLASLATQGHARWMDEIPHAPPRWKSKLFGIPTWIIPIEDYSDDAFNTTTLFSVVIMAAATLSALYYIFVVYLPSQPEGQRNIGRFNKLITGYLVATLIASFTFDLMWAGKVWASFGVFHNLFEIGLLASILIPRTEISHLVFVPFCFLYVTATAAMVIILPWPLDALFFKFQGLSTDFALGVDLYRLYRHNRRLAKDTNAVQMVIDTDASGREKKRRMQPVHSHLLILAIASNLHTLGNTLVTVGNHMILWIVFQFLYAVSFPMYAYYVVSEPNDHRIQWYPMNYVKEALIMISAIVSCGLFIVIGAINSGGLN